MSRQATRFWAVILSAVMLFTGCHPMQPFYFNEDGDLSHYLDTATEIEYPDAQDCALPDASNTKEPLSLTNVNFDELWDLSLEEAVEIALKNSKVMKNLGGVVQAGTSVERILNINAAAGSPFATVYDPALSESNPGTIGSGTGAFVPGFDQINASAPGVIGVGEAGPEAALAAFDARLEAGAFFDNTDSPQNVINDPQAGAIFPTVNQQDQHRYTAQISKRAANGSEFFLRHNAIYTDSNQPFRTLPSDWFANWEVEAHHPLLRGSGTQINRANVVLGRINTDISLIEFEKGARDLVRDVENAYWELFFQYHNLEAGKVARDSALVTWRKIDALKKAGAPGGETEKEAQARQQYYRFRSAVEGTLQDLFRVENRLRYLMGIANSDGRLIRPSDEPTTAKINYNWHEILCESLFRSPELRQRKWMIKRREMELVVARNGLLPRLDVAALYRWLGAGDDLIEANRQGTNYANEGSLAWDELFEGNYQEWSVGVQFEMPIGFRQELAGVRWAQLALARERALLEETELELSHALADRYQDLESFYEQAETNFNWRVAAQKEVDAVQAAYDAGKVTLDVLLDAQQRRAEAEVAFYQALVEYNKAIMELEYRKGSLLEYNGIMLAEGPWPEKAYFDALGHARRRDASYYHDFGHTRPGVISRGPTETQLGPGQGGMLHGDGIIHGDGTIHGPIPTDGAIEGIDVPVPQEAMPIPREAVPGSTPQPHQINPMQETGLQFRGDASGSRSAGPVLSPPLSNRSTPTAESTAVITDEGLSPSTGEPNRLTIRPVSDAQPIGSGAVLRKAEAE